MVARPLSIGIERDRLSTYVNLRLGLRIPLIGFLLLSALMRLCTVRCNWLSFDALTLIAPRVLVLAAFLRQEKLVEVRAVIVGVSPPGNVTGLNCI